MSTPDAAGPLPRRLLRYRRLLSALQPDCMVTYNWGAIEWAMARLWGGPRHVHVEDGFGPDEADRQLPRRVAVRRLVLNRGSTLVVPSRVLKRLAREHWQIAPERIVYLPNGIDCDRYLRPPDPVLLETLKIPRSTPLIGTVAALRPEKNLVRLIDAVSRLSASRDAHLVLIGDGPQRTELEERAKAAGMAGGITFAGHQPKPEALLGALQIFALSSDTEQMPISVLEAMAAERVIAAVDVGDVATMVARENAPFIVPRNTDALSGVIDELLGNSKLCGDVGRANGAKVRAQYTIETMISNYERIFAGKFDFDRDGRSQAAERPAL